MLIALIYTSEEKERIERRLQAIKNEDIREREEDEKR